MVPLALFSYTVPKPELRHLSKRLLTTQPADEVTIPGNHFGTGFGKPNLPTNITVTTRLGYWNTGDSGFIFRLFDMDIEFLNEDVDNWPCQSSFLS